MTNLRWKLLAIVVVLGLSVWAFTPPSQKVRLGLDLKGGVHLVLRVQTDDALRLYTGTVADRLREDLQRRGVTAMVTVSSSTQFKVEGVTPDQDAAFREAATEVAVDYNRESGVSGSYDFVMRPNIIVQLRDETVQQALQTIERRVNEFGVAEPIVAPYGAGGDQILVQLPGVTDVARAKELIRSTALLELKLVEDGPAASREALLATRNGVLPADMEVLPGVPETAAPGERGGVVYYLVRKVAGRDGSRSAKCASVARSEQSAGRRLFPESGRCPKVFGCDRCKHRPEPGSRA